MTAIKNDLEKLSLDDLSKLFGVSLQTLRDWKKRKIPFPSGVKKDGAKGDWYDWPSCLEWYCQFYLEKTGKGLGPSTKAASFEEARTKKMNIDAEMAEIDLAAKKGLVVPADEVEKAWEDAVLRCRSKLLSIPSKLSPRLNPAMTRVEVEATITKEVREALEELSKSEVD